MIKESDITYLAMTSLKYGQRIGLHNLSEQLDKCLCLTAGAGSCSNVCSEQGQAVAQNLTSTGKGQPINLNLGNMNEIASGLQL